MSRRVRPVWALAAALLLPLAAPPAPGWASGRIDVAHAARDRRRADACILGAVVIYTDPYIGSRLSHREVVGKIARMCARPFAIYAEDLALDAAAARRLLRRTVEAGLRGQFHDESLGEPARDVR
jgi:hypothetical protein